MDTQGLVMKAKAHPADLADREGAMLVLLVVVLEPATDGGLPAPRSAVGGRGLPRGYRGAALREWITERLGLWLEIVQRRSRWVWVRNDEEPEPVSAGFEVIRRRWVVVERTFAWITRNRRMSRDYEFLAETTEALVYVCMIRLMLKRLAKGTT